MDKIKELLAKIASKKEEARGLAETNKVAEAKVLMDEIRSLQEQVTILQELKEDEKRSLETQAEKKKEKITGVKTDEVRALAKFLKYNNSVLALSEEERALVTTSGNSALIPQGFVAQILEIRKNYPSLKPYTNVIPVDKPSGKMPVVISGESTLYDFTEGDTLTEDSKTTKEVDYSVKDAGKIIPVSDDMEEDGFISIIEGVIKPDFALSAINYENKKIFDLVKANATTILASDYENISETVDKINPNSKVNLLLITNPNGYSYLSNLKDATGRKLNLITKGSDGKEIFDGKIEIFTLPVTVCATVTDGKNPFYIANMKEVAQFFDKKGYTIKQSSEFLFNKNQQAVKIYERFDVVKGVADNCKFLEF